MNTNQLALNHFKKHDPIIYPILKQMDVSLFLLPPIRPRNYFSTLCHNIISQQLAGKAADAIIARFETLVGKEILAENILNHPGQQLRDVGLSWAKVKYVKDLALHTQQQKIRYDLIPTMTNEEISQELIQVKGIGQWTVDMFLIFTLKRPDIFSYGDLGLNKGLQNLYGFTTKPTREQIDQIIKLWSPYKSYGSLALWHSLDNR